LRSRSHWAEVERKIAPSLGGEFRDVLGACRAGKIAECRNIEALAPQRCQISTALRGRKVGGGVTVASMTSMSRMLHTSLEEEAPIPWHEPPPWQAAALKRRRRTPCCRLLLYSERTDALRFFQLAGNIARTRLKHGDGWKERTVSRKILLVDDDADVRNIAAEHLNDAGFYILTAEDAAEAWLLFDAHSDIALVVTDVVMPGIMDGVRLADTLKAKRPDVKVIYLTGYSDVLATAAGVVHGSILTKPWHADQLELEVRRTLGMD
jgi:CheY-like chemotaxis protein